ncbi:MAG: hypothetical protein ACRDYV_02975 [Acidimicrobiia bacterium]
MRCAFSSGTPRTPGCPFEGSPRELHAHLADAHPEGVRFEERGERRFYALTCPVCGDGYEHQIKPRGRDPEFMREFEGQIRLVAFDMLVNHLMAEHGEGVDEAAPAEEDLPPPADPTASPAAGGPEWLVEARRKAQGQDH